MAAVVTPFPSRARTRGGHAPILPAGRDKRYAAGKALRQPVPRQEHAEWTPARNRRDPVELVIESSKGRIPELIPIRYGRMMVSLFTGEQTAQLVLRPVLDIYNVGVGPQASKTIIRHGWTIDIRSTAFAGIALAVLAAFFAFLHRGGPQHQVWTPAQGTIHDTRIVPDRALETKWGGQVMWKAEYKVSYSVASREYAVWADSGVRAESEAGVTMALRQSRPSCRVQYNPERPDVSVAVCR